MYATTLIAIFLLHVGFLVVFPAVWLTWTGLAPGWVGAARGAVRRRPILTAVVGAVVGGLGFVVGAGLIAAPPAALKLAGVVWLMLLGLYGMAGVAGFAAHLGSNLPSPVDQERPWKAILRGGVALELTWILPVLGWFVLLPLSLAVGIGAATLGLFAGRDDAAASAPASAERAAVTSHGYEAPKHEPAALHA